MESHPSVPFSPLHTRSYLTTYITPSSPTYSKNIPVPHQTCSKHTTTSHMVRLSIPMRKSSDIEALAQQWQDVQVVDLERCERGAIQGKKKDTARFLSLLFVQFTNLQDTVLHVVPCSLSETVSFAWYGCCPSELSSC